MIRNILISLGFLVAFVAILYYVGFEIALVPSILLTIVATAAVYALTSVLGGRKASSS